MKIIGYNSSHETSLCQFDTDTWEIDFLYEEERFRRQKWFTPKDNDGQLLCVERQRVKTPDHFIGCSFDYLGWNSSNSIFSLFIIAILGICTYIAIQKWDISSEESSNFYFRQNNIFAFLLFVYLITF